MSLFLTASSVTVLAKPASHWEKKPCEQAWRGLHPTPSILHRSNAGLLVGLSLQKTLVPLGLCIRYSLHLKAFLLCVLSPLVPLLRVSPNTLLNYSASFFSPSSLVCFIFSHSTCYLLMCHFLYFHNSPLHLGP